VKKKETVNKANKGVMENVQEREQKASVGIALS
jgi:hypothetical protein